MYNLKTDFFYSCIAAESISFLVLKNSLFVIKLLVFSIAFEKILNNEANNVDFCVDTGSWPGLGFSTFHFD